MNLKEKHGRYMSNLDNAYDLLMEEREAELLEDEIIRDWILEDDALFQRLAKQWLDDPVNREGFLDWAITEVRNERTPAYTRAWMRDPLVTVKP